jgi:methylmalonyl-CoA/ethylmalonyl-CoA epimerase
MADTPIQGIDNIGICVTDLARSVQFYRHLGFEVLFESDRGVTVALGAAKLFLFPAQPGDERTVGRHLGLSGNPPGIDHISFLVDDVDALHASLTARGMDAGPQPADQDWGARAFGLIDPDGNNLYFLRWLLPAHHGGPRIRRLRGRPEQSSQPGSATRAGRRVQEILEDIPQPLA